MAEQPKPTITGKTLEMLSKRSQTQYGSILPLAMDMPPRRSAGKPRAAMPDIARAPMESLVRVLQAFENPSQATERIIPDILNLFATTRGVRAATVVPRTFAEETPIHSSVYGFNYLRDVLSDTPNLGYSDALNSMGINALQAIMAELPKFDPVKVKSEANVSMAPRTTENTTYKLKGK